MLVVQHSRFPLSDIRHLMRGRAFASALDDWDCFSSCHSNQLHFKTTFSVTAKEARSETLRSHQSSSFDDRFNWKREVLTNCYLFCTFENFTQTKSHHDSEHITAACLTGALNEVTVFLKNIFPVTFMVHPSTLKAYPK